MSNGKPKNKSEVAVFYILNRIQSNPDLRYYAGPGTETFRLLCEAEAEALSCKMELVEEERRRDLQPDYSCRYAEVVELRRWKDKALGYLEGFESGRCDEHAIGRDS